MDDQSFGYIRKFLKKTLADTGEMGWSRRHSIIAENIELFVIMLHLLFLVKLCISFFQPRS
jgi:hypothetical protein